MIPKISRTPCQHTTISNMKRSACILWIPILILVITSCSGYITCVNDDELVSQCEFAFDGDAIELSCSMPEVDCTGSVVEGTLTSFECNGEKTQLDEAVQLDEGIPSDLYSVLPIYKRGKNVCSVLSAVKCQYTVKCNLFGKCKTQKENCTEAMEAFESSVEDVF